MSSSRQDLRGSIQTSAARPTAAASQHSSASSSGSAPASASTSRSPTGSIPPDWSFGSRMEMQGGGLPPGVEGSVPLSASSSSSSYTPQHRLSHASSSTSGRSSGPQIRDPRDPFDNTASTFSEDPFGHRGSSSSSGEETFEEHMAGSGSWDPSVRHGVDDGQGFGETSPVGHVRKSSVSFVPHHYRASTDPLRDDGQAIDAEYAGLVPGMDGYNFGEPPIPDAGPSAPPQLNRTFSAPLPARMGSLRHPLSAINDSLSSHPALPHQFQHSFSSLAISPPATARPRPGTDYSDSSSTAVSSSPALSTLHTPLQSLSVELADSVQAVIETLVHLSPPHLLDNAKEQFSGCTVQIPSTSLSAMLTSMRTLNYLAANMRQMVGLGEPERAKEKGILDQAAGRLDDFDIGEMLQNVADLLSGQAARAGVDLVLFHGDVGIKHVSVSGDREGLSFCLSHVIRQILSVCSKGDTIELGLQIMPQSPSMTPRVDLPLTAADVDAHRQRESERPARPASPGRTTLPLPGSGIAEGPLLCIIEIVHNIAQLPGSASVTPRAELNPFTRLAEEREATRPKLDTIICRRMLQQQNALLKQDTQPSSPVGSGLPRRAYELSFLLNRGKPLIEPQVLSVEEEAIRQPFTTMRLAREPTLTELSQFAESLRGKKVMFHASPSSIFARHLISYLSAWGMEVSHIPFEDSEDALAETDRVVTQLNAVSGLSPIVATLPSSAAMQLGESTSSNTNGRDPDKFIMIDDDVAVLRRELIRIRAEATPLTLKPRPLLRRPTMASRARSTPHMRQISQTSLKPSGPVLIHFTSLSNYNHVRDVVSNFLGAPYAAGTGAFVYPEVMVIPKPVGPRRFLTALHTAVYQPIVDPFFSPIATSPRSPGAAVFAPRTPLGLEGLKDTGFFDSVAEETHEEHVPAASVPPRLSPLSEHPPPTVARGQAGLHLSLPTPGDVISMPASEYFSSTNNSKASSAASGVVMQSPDGRPFGMFFEPPVKNDRKTSYSDRRSSYGFKTPAEGPRRKTTRRQSGSVKDDTGSQQQSPVSARRASGLSGRTDEDESRRSSVTNGPINDSPIRATRRRTTLPTQPAEPIVAVGRDRSATVSKQRKGPSASSSPLPPPKEDSDGEASAAQATFPPPKPTKRPTMSQNASERSVAKVKKERPEMVVPPINVLIVEDNPININILSMFLRKKKIKYQTAKDGLEAVEKWRTGGFHLILMDIQLPVMNGIDATKEIRKLEKNHNIGIFPSTPVAEHPANWPGVTLATEPVVPNSPLRSSVIIVALTASSYMTDRVAALAAGCNDFLTKPVSHRWLEQKIVEWGCMQALIDFDGWRRWRGADIKGPSELKKGFQVGPQIAAKGLADRLKIQRKSGRMSPGPPSPAIQLHTATPPPEPSLAQLPEDKGLEMEIPPAGGGGPSDNKLSALQPAPQDLEARDAAK